MATRILLASAMAVSVVGCRGAEPARLTFSGSAVGAEGAVVQQQLARFADLHPGVSVELRVSPDAADQRHQLYVQWLNAHAPEPDVLQLDIIWTAEFAAAGWLRPFEEFPDIQDFVPAAVEANRWQGTLYAVPWFVDVGLLYWRRDLFDAPPSTLDQLRRQARQAVAEGHTSSGLGWQGARYEGLVTVFLEHLGAFGGGVLDAQGAVIVDQPAAVRALTFMRESLGPDGFVPESALTWQEEQTRFAFQNGEVAFMRNWPYAWALVARGTESRVADRVGVSTFPAAEGGHPTAALGGGQLAINRFTAEPDLAAALVTFLTAPTQMLERARVAAQLPARRSLYDTTALADALPLPLADVMAALDSAVARPVTPVYSELSGLLQVHLHRALTGQEQPNDALGLAADEIRALLRRAELSPEHDR